jgi:hypothetical protein
MDYVMVYSTQARCDYMMALNDSTSRGKIYDGDIEINAHRSKSTLLSTKTLAGISRTQISYPKLIFILNRTFSSLLFCASNAVILDVPAQITKAGWRVLLIIHRHIYLRYT